jgi:hypothetical protein
VDLKTLCTTLGRSLLTTGPPQGIQKMGPPLSWETATRGVPPSEPARGVALRCVAWRGGACRISILSIFYLILPGRGARARGASDSKLLCCAAGGGCPAARPSTFVKEKRPCPFSHAALHGGALWAAKLRTQLCGPK